MTRCTGQRITGDFGVLYYPNGQRVVDGFGKEYYPNGTRVTNDYGDEIRYSNDARVRSASGDILFPNGAPVKSASGQVRYPNGQQTRTSTGTCYFETGVEMNPCQRVVPIRDRLACGETAFYQLDTVGGAIDLRNVRYESCRAPPSPRSPPTSRPAASITRASRRFARRRDSRGHDRDRSAPAADVP